MGSRHCFLVCGWIKLKFGASGNLGHLSSNLNSKTQDQFQILRKMPLFFSMIMIFSKALPQESVTMATMNNMSLIFNEKAR